MGGVHHLAPPRGTLHLPLGDHPQLRTLTLTPTPTLALTPTLTLALTPALTPNQATIPNASQFAHWVAAVHRQPCHVIGTSHRPTPLQHWVFPAGGSGLHLVLDEAGHFRANAFERAMAELDNAEAAKVWARAAT